MTTAVKLASLVDSSGNVGIGITDLSVSGANAKLGVSGGVINLDDDYSIAWGGGTGRPSINGNKSLARIRYIAGDHHLFQVANTEQMRLTSTGLGIGTSAPTQKLTVKGNVAIGAQDAFWFRDDDFSSNPARRAWAITSNYDTYGSLSIKVSTAAGGNPISGTTVGMFDSSGNLGLGITPSAWAWRALDLNYSAAVASNGANMVLAQNCYWNGSSWLYKTTNTAQLYGLDATSGEHRWYTAPSGTAGNAIGFTQAMTLDASGNLIIGDTVANQKLQITGTGPVGIRIRDVNTNNWDIVNNSYLAFIRGTTETMRIDSSGNVGIGTIPTYKFQVVGSVNADVVSEIRNDHATGYGLRLSNKSSANYALAISDSTANHVWVYSNGDAVFDGTMKFNSGYGSNATAYGCRAWVNFNGTGTVAIRASGNVSSITDLGTGNYRINYSTAMPDVNYAATANGTKGGGTESQANSLGIFYREDTVFTTSTEIYTMSFSGNKNDPNNVMFSVFR